MEKLGNLSVCVVTRNENSNRLQEDLKVEPKGPVLDVVEIVRDPGSRFFERVDLAAQSIDLSPAGEARFDAVTVRIFLDRLAIEAITCLHRDRMGAWADE